MLDAKKIPYELVDVSVDEKAKERMKTNAHGKTELPQVHLGDVYLGVRVFSAFFALSCKHCTHCFCSDRAIY